MSIARTHRTTSVGLSVALALSCFACSSDSGKNLFGDTPGNTTSAGGAGAVGTGAASNGGTVAQNGSGGTVSPSSGGDIGTSASGGSTPSAGGSEPKGTGSAGSTGGSASSGGAGSGGRADAADSGSDGGSGGSNVDSGSGNADTGPGPGTGGAPGDMMIRCGGTTCNKAAGDVCCIHDMPMGMHGQGPGDPVAMCTKDTANCNRIFRCDSDGDCAGGEHCCMDFTSDPTMPSSACSARACDAALSCSTPGDCAQGQTCCGAIGTVPMVGVKYTSVTCEDTCSLGSAAFCVDDAPCRNNLSCQQSATLPPGYSVCR